MAETAEAEKAQEAKSDEAAEKKSGETPESQPAKKDTPAEPEKDVVTKGDLFRIREGLKSLDEYRGLKFAYAVAKNLRFVESELKLVEGVNKWSKEYTAYQEERQKITLKFAEKDKQGNPIVLGQSPNGDMRIKLTDAAACNKETEALEEKHADLIKEQEKKDEEFKEYLKEPAEVKFYIIPKKLVPSTILVKHLRLIFEVVEQTDD